MDEVRRYAVRGGGKGREDYSSPVLGPNAKEMRAEYRSIISNDDGIVDGTIPPASLTQARLGKFFTRGCRGVIERVEIYSIGDGVNTITLWVAPQPGLGPIYQLTITPGITWGWYGADVEDMWDYDSLFIWVNAVTAGPLTPYARDAVEPFDSRITGDGGITWSSRDERLFIRAIYTGQTPGDVPIAGIINNIPLPNLSSTIEDLNRAYPNFPAELNLLTINGAGDVDAVILSVAAAPGSHNTRWRISCDGQVVFDFTPLALNTLGFSPTTPSITELAYGANAACNLLITKKFQFGARFNLSMQNAVFQTVSVWVFPNTLS